MNENNYFDFLTKMTFNAPYEVTQAIYDNWSRSTKDNLVANLSESVAQLHKKNIETSKKIWNLFLSL